MAKELPYFQPKITSSELINDLVAMEWTSDKRFHRCFLDPIEISRLKYIIGELRRRGDIDTYERCIYLSIINHGRKLYFDFKEHVRNQPRRDAQAFIGKKNVRAFIFKRDDYKCLCCGKDHSLSLDHIIPVNNGGLNRLGNLQTLCSPCNSSKGTKIIDFR